MDEEARLALAKPAMDVCLFTGDARPHIRFWRDEMGLAQLERVPIREGLTQYRFDCGTSVIKVNERLGAQAGPISGFREICIARRDVGGERRFLDPDGNRVSLVGPGAVSEGQIGIRMHVRDRDATHHFFTEVLRLSGPHGSGEIAVGGSRLFLTADSSVEFDPPVNQPGWRYVTLRVFDARKVYAKVIGRGARSGSPPQNLGETVCYALVRDPDGNWVELVQRND